MCGQLESRSSGTAKVSGIVFYLVFHDGSSPGGNPYQRGWAFPWALGKYRGFWISGPLAGDWCPSTLVFASWHSHVSQGQCPRTWCCLMLPWTLQKPWDPHTPYLMPPTCLLVPPVTPPQPGCRMPCSDKALLAPRMAVSPTVRCPSASPLPALPCPAACLQLPCRSSGSLSVTSSLTQGGFQSWKAGSWPV